MKRLLLFISALAVLVSCKKDGEKEGFSDTPSLEMVSLSEDRLVQFKDSLVITVRYKDLNGDLGRTDPDDNALYIKDQRLPHPDYFHIPPLTPDDLRFKTTGTFRIVIPSLFLLGNGGEERTRLHIKVLDQGGHWSNELVTPEIAITPN